MKKGKKFKVSDAVLFKLYEMATELPPMPKLNSVGGYVYKDGVVDGQELLNSGALGADGKPGVPGVKYRAKVLVYRDHKAELLKLYQLEGMEKCEEVVATIKRVYAEKNVLICDQVKTLWQEFKRWWLTPFVKIGIVKA